MGLCLAAILGVLLLSHRPIDNVPMAIGTLSIMVVCILLVGRPLVRSHEHGWRTYTFLTVVATLWAVATYASPAAVAALPALYPLLFATLTLPVALVVVTVLNLVPLTVQLATEGLHGENLSLSVAITLGLLITGPVIGIVVVTTTNQRARLASLVAELAESRAETARLSLQAGAAGERERLARDIHDTLAQGFTSIVALAQATEPALDTDPVQARRYVELIRETARENLAEARDMVAGLTPAALDDSLTNAIARQADRLRAETGIAVTVVADPKLPALGMAADVVLLRAAQESFANVRKHAAASAVRVELGVADGTVRLTITDNGVGLADSHADGFGLRGMRARAQQIGGQLSVSSTPGGGTTLQIEVPA